MPSGNFGTVYGNIRNARQRYITELFDAVESNNINNVKKVLEAISVLKLYGVIDAENFTRNQVALDIACHNGNLDIVKALVKAGANVNAADIDNVPPLGYAATRGFSDIVIYLSSLPNINPNILRTGEFVSETPLMYAAWKCSSEAVNALLYAKADATAVNIRNNHSTLIYALHNLHGKVEADKIISLLIDKGAKIDEIFLTQYTDKYGIKYTSKNNENQDGGRRNLKSKSRKSKTRKSRKSRKSRK